LTIVGLKADEQRLAQGFGDPVRIALLVNGFANETGRNSEMT
jgi:hypothetical protein